MDKTQYMIKGAVDNGSPNVDVFYISEDKEKAIKVYRQIIRLEELTEKQNEEDKEEFDKLYQDLQDEGCEIFSENDWIGDYPVDFEVSGIYEFKIMEIEGWSK